MARQYDFYLLGLSFQSHTGAQPSDLRDKIEQLAIDCDYIREQEETIYRHDSIYDIEILPGYKIQDIIWPNTEILDRDQRAMLQIIIDHCKSTSLEDTDILELLPEHSEDLVNGLLCLYEVPTVDPMFLVYSKNDWLHFHKHFLGIYPVSETHFYESCVTYFPDLFFHSQNEGSLHTLEGGLSIFSKCILNCLDALEQTFYTYYDPQDIPSSLRAFSTACGVETTLEGNKNRKEDFTFTFIDIDGNSVEVCCEPHMKLSQSDQSGDSHYYFNRIYFHGGKKEVENGKLLVGHIGGHL